MRVKGELFLQDSGDQSAVTAEQYFGPAIEVGRRQGALLWELRRTLHATEFGRAGKTRRGKSLRRCAINLRRASRPTCASPRMILESLPSRRVGSER
jgi:hypothetical protein